MSGKMILKKERLKMVSEGKRKELILKIGKEIDNYKKLIDAAKQHVKNIEKALSRKRKQIKGYEMKLRHYKSILKSKKKCPVCGRKNG